MSKFIKRSEEAVPRLTEDDSGNTVLLRPKGMLEEDALLWLVDHAMSKQRRDALLKAEPVSHADLEAAHHDEMETSDGNAEMSGMLEANSSDANITPSDDAGDGGANESPGNEAQHSMS